jgi:SAM-dependent methyltransferase
MNEAAFDELARLGAESWERFGERPGVFHRFIPTDLRGMRAQLTELAPRATTFLELGSGVGVITILADLMGYEAYGIEIAPELLAESERLARHFGSKATFALGSFVPAAAREDVDLLDADLYTPVDGDDAFQELELTLADFDLVFGYPFPDEEEWMRELVRRGAGDHTAFLCYSVRDGFTLTELGRGARRAGG